MEKILLIDDEKIMHDIIKQLLKNENKDQRIICAQTGENALKEISKKEFSVILLDIKLPDINGIELLKKIRNNGIKSEVIIITGHGDVDNAVEAMKMGAYDYIEKPFNNNKLELTIDKAIQSYNLKKEVVELKNKIDETMNLNEKMGESRQIKKVLNQVDLVTNKNITVFLEGETGSGKDLIAKIIHNKSKIFKGSFVPVDCGAIPDTLFESELFGHVKGAFTNATSDKKGKFEQANGGTLFLDEITNLPLNLQAKFLRALQEREIYRLGSSKPRKIDVRIIVATNKDIKNEIDNNNFRLDLFYRLHEFKIHIPCLRERKADIPVITSYFIKQANSSLGTKIKGITPDAMEKLLKYHWPGNVRELRNVIKRAAIHCNEELIDIDHLKFISDEKIDNNDDWINKFFEEIDFNNSTLEEMLNKTEQIIVDAALNKAKGVKKKAAEILDVSRWSIYRKASESNHKK